MKYEYIQHIKSLIDVVEREEASHIAECIQILADAICSKNSIYIFGASHAGILSQESFYRAGGLVPITPIWAREVLVNVDPITLTSSMERCVGYGTIIARTYKFKRGDVVIVHSVSGRNPVSVEVAQVAHQEGCTVIGVTNLSYSQQTTSRHPSGKRLFEICDIVLDNHGEIGDACVEVAGTGMKAGPTSTIIGALMLNTIYTEVANELVKRGMDTPPIFYSANVDGGDEKNRVIFEKYKDQIHYKF